MNRYKVELPLVVHTEDREGVPGGSYKQGEEFEYAFTEDEENENIASGLLSIVPQEYKVIGGSNVHGADPDETFIKALRMGEEALLIAGGHIERVKVEEPKPKTKPAAKRKKKEE